MKIPGGFGELLSQAQKIKQSLTEVQSELGEQKVEGSSGGGLVKIVLSGDMKVLDVSIDPSLLTVDEVEMLQDLVQAAFNDGLKKTKDLLKERFGQLTGGLSIPGLSF